MRFQKTWYAVMCICLFIFVPNLIDAQEQTLNTVSGSVLNGDEPIPFATVVIGALEIVEYTDESGNFTIMNVPVGSYTVLVIADGFGEKEFPLETTNNGRLLDVVLQMSDMLSEQVFQEEIIVTGERLQNSTSGVRTISKHEIDTLPMVNDDPVSIIEQDTGFVSMETGPEMVDGGVPVFKSHYSFSRDYSLYGGDTSWNRYFFGHIQIPTNMHISNPFTSVITNKAVNDIAVYKGMPPGIYGPGMGGTLVMSPRVDDYNYLYIDASITDPRITLNYWINNNIQMFIAARQSISQWTIVPIANLIINEVSEVGGEIKGFYYGDMLFSLNYYSDIHEVSFLTMLFYDFTEIDLSGEQTDSSSTGLTGKAEGSLFTQPKFLATGINWDMLVGDNTKNTLVSYVTYYASTVDMLLAFDGDPPTENSLVTEPYKFKIGYDGYVNTLNIRLLDHFQLFLNDQHALTFGLEFQWLQVDVKHNDILEFNIPSSILDIPLSEQSFSAEATLRKGYGFTEYNFTAGIFENKLTAGVSQLVGEESNYETFPSFRASTDINFNSPWKLSWMASLSPSFLEGSKMGDKIVGEKISNYENESRYTKPTYGVTTVPKLTYQVTQIHQLSLEPFFAYYYNFSGSLPNLILGNLPGATQGYIYITPSRGWSAGGAVAWRVDHPIHKVNMSYTLGYAMYETEEYGWLHPSNDYRHQFKIAYTYKIHEAFQIGISSYVYLDYPFTPYTLRDNPKYDAGDDVEDKYVREGGDPLSARTYLPQYGLLLNINGNIIKRDRWKMSYRVQPGDVLNLLQVTESIKNEYAGASIADVDNRTHEYNLNIGSVFNGILISISFEIKLP